MIHQIDTKEVNKMSEKVAQIAQIKQTTTLAQLSKVADFDLLKKSAMFYLNSQIAHSKYNQKKTQLYKKALLAGITVD